jgi:hypothetical protein
MVVSVMGEELDAEKRAITKSWAKREKQIERVLMTISATYGELQGIFGKALPNIDLLELDASANGNGTGARFLPDA